MFKNRHFGHAFFIVPHTDELRHSVVCVSRETSRLATLFRIESLDFREGRGVQAGDALYVLFGSRRPSVLPVRVMKISNLPDKPIIEDFPEMPNQDYLREFAVSCLADNMIIVSGGDRSGGA